MIASFDKIPEIIEQVFDVHTKKNLGLPKIDGKLFLRASQSLS